MQQKWPTAAAPLRFLDRGPMKGALRHRPDAIGTGCIVYSYYYTKDVPWGTQV